MNNALQVALRLLARREYAARELTQKLLARGLARQSVEEALAYCQTQGFQSDDRYVEQLCSARVSQGYGPLKIEQALKQVGIDNAAMTDYFFKAPVDWSLLAHDVLKRNAWRFVLSPPSSDDKTAMTHQTDKRDIKKQHRFLMSRGFSFDVIQVVLREMKTDENG